MYVTLKERYIWFVLGLSAFVMYRSHGTTVLQNDSFAICLGTLSSRCGDSVNIVTFLSALMLILGVAILGLRHVTRLNLVPPKNNLVKYAFGCLVTLSAITALSSVVILAYQLIFKIILR